MISTYSCRTRLQPQDMNLLLPGMSGLQKAKHRFSHGRRVPAERKEEVICFGQELSADALLSRNEASTSLEGTGVVQPLHTSRKGKKQLKPDTAGAAWGHMTAKELTPELKRDLQIIRMRGVLDPKRFYRSSDMKKELPKYFQVGTLIGGAEDAGAKKKPRGTMLQDVMGDAKIRKRTKEQFGKIQAVKALSARPRKGERGAARSSKGKKKKR